MNASAHESYLGLADTQIRAIVQIVDVVQWRADAGIPNGGLCTGTFVNSHLVVTAGHCLQVQNAAVVVQRSDPNAPFILPIVSAIANPSEDVALLDVDVPMDAGDAGELGFEPIVAAGAGMARLLAGDVVDLAGYGLTETNTAGSLRFLAEPVVRTDSTTIVVNGFGSSGSCGGDSGGPLLLRLADGSPVIAGVLSFGSSTCLEDDHYARLDAIQAWIEVAVGPYKNTALECGNISAVGRCFYGSAVWCSGTNLSAETCTGDAECGWDPSRREFRCVSAATDPCHGADSVGLCRDNIAMSCDDGGLVARTCAPCETCRIQGRTGRPGCLAGASLD